jgi:hypothetical protein
MPKGLRQHHQPQICLSVSSVFVQPPITFERLFARANHARRQTHFELFLTGLLEHRLDITSMLPPSAPYFSPSLLIACTFGPCYSPPSFGVTYNPDSTAEEVYFTLLAENA